MSKVTCKYRSRNGNEITIEGDSEDRDFVRRCKQMTGREGMNWQGEWYYPYYTYYSQPYYWGAYPYNYYYYSYYPYYPINFYGGWRRTPYFYYY